MGLDIWLSDGNVLKCWRSMWDVIWHGELGSSLAILNAGYGLDSLMLRYQGVNWLDRANWNCNSQCVGRRRRGGTQTAARMSTAAALTTWPHTRHAPAPHATARGAAPRTLSCLRGRLEHVPVAITELCAPPAPAAPPRPLPDPSRPRRRANPYGEHYLDGISIDPFEVLFVKVKERVLQNKWSFARSAVKYAEIIDAQVGGWAGRGARHAWPPAPCRQEPRAFPIPLFPPSNPSNPPIPLHNPPRRPAPARQTSCPTPTGKTRSGSGRSGWATCSIADPSALTLNTTWRRTQTWGGYRPGGEGKACLGGRLTLGFRTRASRVTPCFPSGPWTVGTPLPLPHAQSPTTTLPRTAACSDQGSVCGKIS